MLRGGIEAIFSALSIRDSKVAPTIHAMTPDPECDLDFVPNEAQDLEITHAMSNSLGFGGHNAVLVFKNSKHKIKIKSFSCYEIIARKLLYNNDIMIEIII